MENSVTKKKRIDWIDVAKAIAIFAMIEGHITPYGSWGRDFIYSFHMMVFYVLTGFTIKIPSSWQDFRKQTLKDFKSLFITYIGAQTVNWALSIIINGDDIAESIKLRITQLIWGSAFDIYGHSCVGIIYFLIALFYAKLVFRLVSLLFDTKFIGIIYTAIAMFSVVLSRKAIYLPQSIDVSMVAVFFIYLGYALHKYFDWYESHKKWVGVLTVLIWGYGIENRLVIDTGGRSYPNAFWGILTAIAGVFVIFIFSEALSSNRVIKEILLPIGRSTKMIMIISFLDWSILPIWGGHGYGMSYILRPLMVIGISLIIEYGIGKVRQLPGKLKK